MPSESILCLSFFDSIIGPSIFYCSETLDPKEHPDLGRILEFSEAEGNFIFTYRKYQTINHIFYVKSEYARGGREILMITYMIRAAYFKDEITDVYNFLLSKAPDLENFANDPKIESKEKIFENFYNEKDRKETYKKAIIKKDKVQIIEEVTEKINDLFSKSCYEIDPIKVEFFDEETLYIEFTGTDSALLIGKEGYRYKALSYILFNWINDQYGLMLRLEVAEFLQNQETAIENYLEPVIEVIKENGSFKTKTLDGILVHIALKRLREAFPEKYVAVKSNIKGEKYILVNEYKKQH